MVVLIAAIAGVLIAFSHRGELLPIGGTPVRVATVVLLVILGWGLARALGQVAGEQEGIVGSLGLFYTTLVSGADRLMVPNSVVLSASAGSRG